MRNYLFILSGIGSGGASESLYVYLSKLSKTNCKIHLIAPYISSERMYAKFKDLNIYIEIIDCGQFHSSQASVTPFYKIPFEFFKYFLNKNKLFKYIKNERIDVVHLNTTCLTHLLKPIATKFKIPIFVFVRELILNKSNNFYIGNMHRKNIIKWATRIICISENEARSFCNCKNLSIIYNPFLLKKNTILKNESKLKKVFRIIMIGQFSYNKAHHIFLKSVRYFINKKPKLAKDCKFIILGVPKNKNVSTVPFFERKNIRHVNLFYKNLENLDLKDHIEVYQYTQYPEKFISEADLLVRPSLSADPWGRDIIEAMSYSTAIIATGKYDRYVRNNINGFLVEPNNPKSIAEAMAKIIPYKVDVFSSNSFKLSKKLFDPDNYLKKMLQIYDINFN